MHEHIQSTKVVTQPALVSIRAYTTFTLLLPSVHTPQRKKKYHAFVPFFSSQCAYIDCLFTGSNFKLFGKSAVAIN